MQIDFNRMSMLFKLEMKNIEDANAHRSESEMPLPLGYQQGAWLAAFIFEELLPNCCSEEIQKAFVIAVLLSQEKQKAYLLGQEKQSA